MSQKNSNSSRIDRRSLLQAVGTAGVIGATGLGATNTVSASDQSEVFDISSREATTKDYENLEQHTDTSNLLESITDRGFTVGFEHAQAADVEAIDSLPAEFEENEVTANEFNDINPRVLFIPCAKSETELGLIVTTVANTEDGDEAVPINAFATVSEEIQSSSDSEQSSEMKVDTLAFEAKDTSSLRPASTSQLEDRTVQTISSTKKTVTPQSTLDSDLSTAQSIGPIGPQRV